MGFSGCHLLENTVANPAFYYRYNQNVLFYADPNAEKPPATLPPTTGPASPSPSPALPEVGGVLGQTAEGDDTAVTITEIVVPVVAGVVILALLVVMTVLMVYLRRNHQTTEATLRPISLPLARAGLNSITINNTTQYLSLLTSL